MFLGLSLNVLDCVVALGVLGMTGQFSFGTVIVFESGNEVSLLLDVIDVFIVCEKLLQGASLFFTLSCLHQARNIISEIKLSLSGFI